MDSETTKRLDHTSEVEYENRTPFLESRILHGNTNSSSPATNSSSLFNENLNKNINLISNDKPGNKVCNNDQNESIDFPIASNSNRKIQPAPVSTNIIVTRQNISNSAQGVKRPRKVTGQPNQPNKITQYFMKHNQ